MQEPKSIFEHDSFILKGLSHVYKRLVDGRNAAYDRQMLSNHRLPGTTISVGNLTVGGTGKTPLTLYLAEWLRSAGRRVAILSRGYKRLTTDKMVVSDGAAIQADWEEVGDEPYLTAHRLTGVPILVNKNRYQAGLYAAEHFQSDVFLLDDGFQHRQLVRDVNIVLIDAAEPFANGYLLPAGPLREPVQAVRRADFIVFSDFTGESFTPPAVIEKSDIPWIGMRYDVEKIRSIISNFDMSPDALKGKKVLGFAGIGSPGKFRRSLEQLEVEVRDFIPFPDHYAYNRRDVQEICDRFQKAGGEFILTTEKDEVKLKKFPLSPYPFFALRIVPRFIPGPERLFDLITPHLKES